MFKRKIETYLAKWKKAEDKKLLDKRHPPMWLYCIGIRKRELRECELYVVDEFMREMEDNQ